MWSGGDYPTNTAPIAVISNEDVKYNPLIKSFASNGESVLKITFNGLQWSWINLHSLTHHVNETINIQLKIYNNLAPVTVRLIELPSHVVDAVVSVNDQIQTVNLSLTTNSESTMKLQINTAYNSTVYVDDVRVFKV